MILLVLIALSAGGACAQETEVSVARSGDGYEIDVELENYDGSPVLEALSDNMRSQITYLVRLYRSADMLQALFGDRLVREFSVEMNADWDPFRREYTISAREERTEAMPERSGSGSASGRPGARAEDAGNAATVVGRYENPDAFLRHFFTLEGLEIPASMLDREHQWYILVQVRVKPIRLVPALGILSFFGTGDVVETPWNRVALPVPEESR